MFENEGSILTRRIFLFFFLLTRVKYFHVSHSGYLFPSLTNTSESIFQARCYDMIWEYTAEPKQTISLPLYCKQFNVEIIELICSTEYLMNNNCVRLQTEVIYAIKETESKLYWMYGCDLIRKRKFSPRNWHLMLEEGL